MFGQSKRKTNETIRGGKMTCKICGEEKEKHIKNHWRYPNGQEDIEEYITCGYCGNLIWGDIKTIKKRKKTK